MDKTVRSFVSSEDYKKYESNKKQTINGTGKIVEKIYIENEIKIKKQNISVNQTIYLDTDDLAKYLLFGTTESQAEYTVKAGDTISSVAYNNKMSRMNFY